MQIILSRHIWTQMAEREISEELVRKALTNPDHVVEGKKGRKVAHLKFQEKDKEYLLRVVFKEDVGKRTGITVYKTSNIKKYWR